jgi:hypothetical protein
MHYLVVKEHVRSETFQDASLLNTAEEKRLIRLNVPLTQRRHKPFMGWGIPRGHNGYANRGNACWALLNGHTALKAGKLSKELVQWAR